MLGQIITLVSLIACIGLNVPFNVDKTIKYDEVVTTESIKQRNYQHTENVGNTVVTYKYESNEVNSFDDLIEGNIYHYRIEDISVVPVNTPLINCVSIVRFYFSVSVYDCYLSFDGNTYFQLFKNDSSSTNLTLFIKDSNTNNNLKAYYFSVSEIDMYFTYHDSSLFLDNSNYIYSTDFNEIESVTYEQPTTIVGVINEFCENYLFSEIPFVNAMTFEIGGQSINLMTWLVMLVGIALSIGILILLFVVFKWLFLLFAGIFKR